MNVKLIIQAASAISATVLFGVSCFQLGKRAGAKALQAHINRVHQETLRQDETARAQAHNAS